MAYTGSIPDTAARRGDWTEQAACTGKKLELFFERKHELEARTTCAVHCQARAQCLAEILTVERGMSRDHRNGIFAGLDGNERWHLDPTAVGHADDGSTLLTTDGPPPPCGTEAALLRHLALGVPVDDRCWSGYLRRVHGNAGRARTAAPKPQPEKKAGPECGTEQAWYLHRRRKQKCQVCDDARAERTLARRREVLEEEHLKGGSERGYMVHRRIGEPPCDACTAGARRDRQDRLAREASQPKRDGLTEREQQVRDLLAEGLSSSEVARRAGVSRGSVLNIRRRLGLLDDTPAAELPRPRGETARERRVWVLWSTGASDFEIARRMGAAVPWVRRVRDRFGLLPNLHAKKAS
ncbi:MAG: hypothetical protein HOY79_50020 [Streptomyces sp.]|nr:hypothetical protein [Streptomyces sp.]